jgi:hypothetical protein
MQETYDSSSGKRSVSEYRGLGEQGVARRREENSGGEVTEWRERKNMGEEEEEEFVKKWDTAKVEIGEKGRGEGVRGGRAGGGYLEFAKERRGEMEGAKGEASEREVAKKLGEEWKGLSEEEKARYERKREAKSKSESKE